LDLCFDNYNIGLTRWSPLAACRAYAPHLSPKKRKTLNKVKLLKTGLKKHKFTFFKSNQINVVNRLLILKKINFEKYLFDENERVFFLIKKNDTLFF